MTRLPRPDLILIPILGIGFAIRLVGIGIGLPDYPDPRESLIAQDILNLIHLKAPPEIYNWPGTAWFYLVAVVGRILEFLGLDLTIPRIIWIARFTNTLLSTATIWLTYQVGVRFYGHTVGLISSGLLAVAMLHATNESRFALVDIPATFCVTWLIWSCTGAQSLSIRRIVWIGVIAGLAFAVKFTTAFAGLSVLALLIRERPRPSEFVLKLAIVIGVSAMTFTVVCPYWLIDLLSPQWNHFFDAFLYETSHYRRGHFGLFATGEIDWFSRFTYLWTLLRWGMCAPLALLSLIGVLLAMIERRDSDKMLLAFILAYLLFVGSHKLKFARHLLLIYPALTLFAAATVIRLSMQAVEFLRLDDWAVKAYRKGMGAVVFAVAVYSLVYSAAFAGVMATRPTAIEAAEWIEVNMPSDEPLQQEPEILFTWLLPKLDRQYAEADFAEWVIILMPNAEVFLNYAVKPESYSEIDWYPMAGVQSDVAMEFYERIFGDSSPYALAQTFQRRPHFLGIPISDRDAPFPMRALAHPEIRIYQWRH